MRIYADTSVVGGCYDEEFSGASLRFFSLVATGRLLLLISDLVIAELEDAPPQVQAVISQLPSSVIEHVDLTEEVFALRDAYIEGDVLAPRWLSDAAHVATATVARADAIVSWNFRHIVRLDRMQAYNRINVARGYAPLTIITPLEAAPHAPNDEEEI